ncbi:MAG: SHOCT domain-containing protein [Ilumatobacteraceae bacterium]
MSLIAAEWGSGQMLWSFLWFFMFFIWIWLLIAVFSDIFRSHDLSGWGKGLWTVGIIVLPYIGVLAYLIIRGHKMSEHAAEAAKAQDAAFKSYVQQAAGTTGPSTADELARLHTLHEQGVLDDAEYATAKTKVLA